MSTCVWSALRFLSMPSLLKKLGESACALDAKEDLPPARKLNVRALSSDAPACGPTYQHTRFTCIRRWADTGGEIGQLLHLQAAL